MTDEAAPLTGPLQFDEDTHTYTVGGVVVPSVTEVCRFLTVDVAEGARPWLRDEAARRGTLVHELCAEYDFTEGDVKAPAYVAGYVQGYVDFMQTYRPHWLAIEQPLAERKRRFAGTIDRVGITAGKLTVVDIKTGSKVNKAAVTAQLNGYRILWCANFGQMPVQLLSLQLRKDGSFTVRQHNISSIFIDCLSLHRWQQHENQVKRKGAKDNE